MSAKASFCTVLSFLAVAATQDIPDSEVLSPPTKGADGAYETCSCINVNASAFDNFAALGPNIPSTYGSSCKAWDANGKGWSQCRVAKPPQYCSLKWCYVDVNCNLPYSRSEVLEGEVYYSWSACGSINFLDRTKGVDASRVFKNGLLLTGMQTTEKNTVQEIAVLSYARELLAEAGINPDFQVVDQKISEDAKEVMGTSSTYTMCVYDAAIGLLDFCLYDFWLTPARINTGAVPIPVFGDTFFLFVPIIDHEETFGDKLSKPFAPFSWNLWALCAAVVFAYGLLLSLFQNKATDVRHLLEHEYLSLLGFFSAGVVEDANELRPASKILTVGFAFFVLIAIASFTGSTASFLITENTKPSVSDIHAALSQNMKICYPAEIKDALMPKFPDLGKLGVPVAWSSTHTIFDEIRDGKCEVAVASYDYSISSEKVCGFTSVGHKLHSVPVGYFVSQELGQKLTYCDSKLQDAGIWGKLEANMNRLYPCPQNSKQDGNLNQLDATHMMGNCFVVVASALLGLVVHCLHKGSEVAMSKANSFSSFRRSMSTVQDLEAGNVNKDPGLARRGSKTSNSSGRSSGIHYIGEEDSIGDTFQVIPASKGFQ